LNEEKIGYAIELIHQTIKKKYSSKIAELVTKVHLELKSSNTKAQSDSKELSNLLKEIALNKPGNLSTAVRAAALFLLVKLSLPINPEFFTYSQFQEDPVLKETSEWALSNARL
jgi:phosphoenolpyruvate carboxylase